MLTLGTAACDTALVGLLRTIIGGIMGLRERSFNFLTRFRSRLSQRQYLAVHLLFGFAVAVVSLWAFIAITEDIVHHDRLTQIDGSFASWLHVHITPNAVAYFKAASFVGSPTVVGVVGILAALGLGVKRQWRSFIALIAAFLGSGAINWSIKQLIQRPRPEYSFANVHDASFSFPSGHAMGSLVAYGIVAYMLIRYCQPGPRLRKIIIAFTVALVFAIGLSRLYLEVHYLSDVIAGYLAGAVWLVVCISGVELSDFEKRAPRS